MRLKFERRRQEAVASKYPSLINAVVKDKARREYLHGIFQIAFIPCFIAPVAVLSCSISTVWFCRVVNCYFVYNVR